MGRFLDIIREVQSERVTNIINTCNEGMGLCICTWTWSCLHLKKANKFELRCCCSSIIKEEHRGTRSLKEFLKWVWSFLKQSFTSFCEILDIALWGSIYHMGQSLCLANQIQSYMPFLENIVSCACLIWWFDSKMKKVQSLWLANQSQLCCFTGPFWRILYLVHIVFDTAIWLQNEIGQPLWLINQRKLYFFIGLFCRILYLVPMPRTNFILNWLT
jgi:hypothetical protein